MRLFSLDVQKDQDNSETLNTNHPSRELSPNSSGNLGSSHVLESASTKDKSISLPAIDNRFNVIENRETEMNESDLEGLEPLFSEFLPVESEYFSPKTNFVQNAKGYKLSNLCHTRGDILIIWDESIHFESKYIDKPFVGSLTYLLSNKGESINNSVINNNTTDDVTVLPENICSYSQLLYLVSARCTRLALL